MKAKSLDSALLEKAVGLSDRLRDEFIPQVSNWADQILAKASVSLPSADDIEKAASFFKRGVPVGNCKNIGVLVSAAWETIVASGWELSAGSIEKMIRHISDLVLKSVEVSEFNKWCDTDAR